MARRYCSWCDAYFDDGFFCPKCRAIGTFTRIIDKKYQISRIGNSIYGNQVEELDSKLKILVDYNNDSIINNKWRCRFDISCSMEMINQLHNIYLNSKKIINSKSDINLYVDNSIPTSYHLLIEGVGKDERCSFCNYFLKGIIMMCSDNNVRFILNGTCKFRWDFVC